MRYVFYVIIVAFIVTRPELRRVWSELDLRRRRYLGTIFVLLLVGQVVALKYQTYPFVKWGMYESSGTVAKFVEYRGVRSDGNEAPFPIAHLVRTHSTSRALECPTCGKRFLWRMRGFTRELEKLPSGPERDEIFDLYQRTLQAAWRVYKRRHPDEDFEKVQMFRNHISVTDFQQGEPISSSFLWEVELEPDEEAS